MSRSYSALYVDVGYLLSASASRVAGSSLRAGVVVDHQRLIQQLIAFVEERSGLPLLRVNWYDSGRRNGNPDEEQDKIGRLPQVKLRLGRLSYSGEQKGVDLRIGLDLATHSRNRIVDIVYLLSGDDDLTEAVEEAQHLGTQVIVLAVPDREGQPHGVARHLWREADDVQLLDGALIDGTVFRRTFEEHHVEPSPELTTRDAAVPQEALRPLPTSGSGPSPASMPVRRIERPLPARQTVPDMDSVDPALLVTREEETAISTVATGVVEAWFRSATPSRQQQLKDDQPYIPPDLDRALLVDLSERMGVYEIGEAARHRLRGKFWEAVASQ
ncbi:NYN domain-containing protein [Calidifontibacter terrae]